MPKYYKVLNKRGEAIHGGSYTKYDLPRQLKNGRWEAGVPMVIPAKDKLWMCAVGLHITCEPWKWMDRRDVRVFEVDGFVEEIHTQGIIEDKICVRRVCLTKECSKGQLRWWRLVRAWRYNGLKETLKRIGILGLLAASLLGFAKLMALLIV